jgi:hypothetical protein
MSYKIIAQDPHSGEWRDSSEGPFSTEEAAREFAESEAGVPWRIVAEDGFIVKHTITDDSIRNLLINAFEGGSNYWYMIERYDYGSLGPEDFKQGGPHFNDEYERMDHYLLPFVPGTGLVISNRQAEEPEDVTEYRLDRAAIQKGLEVMKEKFPHHWRDFIGEDDDAITADVFLQCALMGDVIYG